MRINILFIIFCLTVCMTLPAVADEVYGAKSSAKTQNASETVQIDVVPLIELNTNRPRTINDSTMYVAPIIMPADEKATNPTMNINLGNLKNVKKAPLLPNDEANMTLNSNMQYFNASYDRLFSNLVSIVDNSEMELSSYDSSSGRIFAKYKDKPIYITASQYNSKIVLVKITPADGIYDIPQTIVSKIFSDLNKSLVTK